MKFEIKVPAVGESIHSADIEKWEKASGDKVQKGDLLAILETDKASMEIPAEHSGILNILKKKGETVSVGDVIGFIDSNHALLEEQTQKKENSIKETEQTYRTEKAKTPAEKQDQKKFINTKENLSPSVRRLVETHSLKPSEIEGTGPKGRLTKEDILTALQEPSIETKETSPSSPFIPEATKNKSLPQAQTETTTDPLLKPDSPTERKGQRRETMTNLRRKTAERLVQSQHNTATLSTFNEVDLSRIMEIRKNYQAEFTKKHGVKLGFMSFFVKAVVSALKEYPRINAFIEGADIVYNDHQHIGIAVSTEKGLVVPVLFYAGSLNPAEIERKIIEYRDKALSRRLSPDDLIGGTFTISNGGVFGSLLSTPILNPPQSGILGMHKIEERPVAKNGKVEIRPMMYITLSYDHRIVDGRESVGFLVKVKEYLEEPARLIIDL